MATRLDDALSGPESPHFAGQVMEFFGDMRREALVLEDVLGLTTPRKTAMNFLREAAYAAEQFPAIAVGFTRKKHTAPNGVYADVQDTIDTLVERAPNHRIILIGYSLGGIHARAYAQMHPEHVALCFMVVTPQQGTPRANLGRLLRVVNAYGPSVEQMIANNPWIEALNDDYIYRRDRFRTHGTRFVNFRAMHDELVPRRYSALPGVDAEYAFGGLGHMSALQSARLYHHLIREIRDVSSSNDCPILLLHGYGLDHTMFRRLRDQLQAHHPDIIDRVHAIDYDYTTAVPFSAPRR